MIEPKNLFGTCEKHNRGLEVSKFLYDPVSGALSSAFFSIFCMILYKFYEEKFLGCLKHANDICPDCAYDKKCGGEIQTEACYFMKISEINKQVQDETAKIKGTAILTDLSPIGFV